jgi:iron complex transport system substrate-binding protein
MLTLCRRNLLLLLSVVFLNGCLNTGSRTENKREAEPRIVSLAPSLTEMLFAIGAGDHLIGRTSACDWPAAVSAVPVVGAFGRPSLEMLASLAPDLVVDVDLADEKTGEKITALHIRRERIACRTPDDIPAALKKLGDLTGHRREADSLAQVITTGLESFRKENALKGRKTSVYLEIWDDPLWTGGKSSYTSSLISYAGGCNIGDVVGKEYFEISPEWVIRKNPGLIACMYMSRESSAQRQIENRPGWNVITAVKKGRVYDRFDNNIFLRPGPRVLEGIAKMRELLDSP